VARGRRGRLPGRAGQRVPDGLPRSPWGGHGYITENGIEQIYRDARISTLYEGTTGIQALDLLGRKVMLDKAKLALKTITSMNKYSLTCMYQQPKLFSYAFSLSRYTFHWGIDTLRLLFRARSNRDVVGAASHDYLMRSGYITLGYWWLRMMSTAQQKLSSTETKLSKNEKKFYEEKIMVGRYYFERVLPRAKSHAITSMASTKGLMDLKDSQV